MPSEKWSFWRDGAKLWVCSRGNRMKWIVGLVGFVLPTLVSWLLFSSFPDWSEARSIISSLVSGAIVFVVLLLLESLWKGEVAGNSLYDTVARMRTGPEFGRLVARTKHNVTNLNGRYRSEWGSIPTSNDKEPRIGKMREWRSAVLDEFMAIDSYLAERGQEPLNLEPLNAVTEQRGMDRVVTVLFAEIDAILSHSTKAALT